MASSHSTTYILLSVLVAILFILCQVVNFVLYGGSYATSANSTDLYVKYPTEITPLGWSSLDTGMTYLFQIGWISHVLFNIFRTNNGGPFYRNPEIVSSLFLSMYCINAVLLITWLILANSGLKEVTLVVWIPILATLGVCLLDYHHRINRHVKEMAQEHKIDLVLFRIFLQNGVSNYITWCAIATILNLTIILVYTFSMSQMSACVVALSLLVGIFLAFAGIEMWYWERYTRYTFSPYLTVAWALVGSLRANWDPSQFHQVYLVVVLVIVLLCFVVKLVSSYMNSQRNPLYTSEERMGLSE